MHKFNESIPSRDDDCIIACKGQKKRLGELGEFK